MNVTTKAPMRLASSAFPDGGEIPQLYTCDGEGFNPPLTIEDVPVEAQSLTLIVEDPDSPQEPFTHWLLWNMSADQVALAENAVAPAAIQGSNSAEQVGYFPPCPNQGRHRYVFTLYALDSKLDLPMGANKAQLLQAFDSHLITHAQLVGYYERTNSPNVGQ